jgi:predicted transcriptional regulator
MKLPKLTDSQLQLMHILWDRGEATVSEVWQALPEDGRVARTTVMTVLSRLADKGWLLKGRQGGELVYRAAVDRDKALRGILAGVVDGVFRGSAEQLVSTLIHSSGISKEEADRLRRIIESSAEDEP